MRRASLAAAALLPLAAAASAWASPRCGLRGNLENRIADCAKSGGRGGLGTSATRAIIAFDAKDTNDPLGGMNKPSLIWRVVAQTDSGRRVWLDEATGLLWSLAEDSADPCPDSAEARRNRGGIPLSFRRPQKEEAQTGASHKVDIILDTPAQKLCVAVGAKPKPQKPAKGPGD